MAILAALILASHAAAVCIERHSVPIASGTGPSGEAWRVDGSIGNNGSCREWLLGIDFEIGGAGSWGTATGISPGGHLRRDYGVSASDELLHDGSYRVVSGLVNAEVATVQFTLSNNRRLKIEPRVPSSRLRRQVSWLRNIGYFVSYYPPVGFVTGVATFSASGQLLYRDKTYDGF